MFIHPISIYLKWPIISFSRLFEKQHISLWIELTKTLMFFEDISFQDNVFTFTFLVTFFFWGQILLFGYAQNGHERISFSVSTVRMYKHASGSRAGPFDMRERLYSDVPPEGCFSDVSPDECYTTWSFFSTMLQYFIHKNQKANSRNCFFFYICSPEGNFDWRRGWGGTI